MLIAPLSFTPLTPAALALAVCGLFTACFALGWFGHWLALWLQPAWRRFEAWHAALVPRLPAPAHPLLRLPVWLLQRTFAELMLLAAAGALLLGTGAVFIEVLEAVVEPERLALLDRAVFTHLQGMRQPWLDTVMVAITELGGAWVTVPLVATVAAALLVTGRRAAAAYWLGAHFASRLSVAVLKATLGRDRPIDMYHGWEAYSFPSGHATTSMVTYGLLWVLLGQGRRWPARSALFAAATMTVVLIGASRLYLGVHWLSDVVAGFALGLGWVTLLAVAYRLFHGATTSPRLLAPLVAATLALAWGWRCWWELPQLLQLYAPSI